MISDENMDDDDDNDDDDDDDDDDGNPLDVQKYASRKTVFINRS